MTALSSASAAATTAVRIDPMNARTLMVVVSCPAWKNYSGQIGPNRKQSCYLDAVNSAAPQIELRQRDVRRRFDLAAAGFDAADFAHAVARKGLLDRLEPMVVEASTVIEP